MSKFMQILRNRGAARRVVMRMKRDHLHTKCGLMRRRHYWPVGVDDWFKHPFESMYKDMHSLMHPGHSASAFAQPRVEVTTNKDVYEIKCEVPGVEKDQISVSLKKHEDGNQYLHISGERKDTTTNQQKKDGEYYSEITSYGAFSRTMQLPHDCVLDNIKAKHENGLLMLSIKRKHEDAPKLEETPITIE